MLVEKDRAFGRVGELGAERGVVAQALVAGDIEIEIGIQEHMQRAFDGGLAGAVLFVLRERFDAAVARDVGAACEDGLEQRQLVREVVVHQRRVDADLVCDVAHRHAVKAVFREQDFGGVHDLAERFGALLRLGARRGLWRASRRTSRLGCSHHIDPCRATRTTQSGG